MTLDFGLWTLDFGLWTLDKKMASDLTATQAEIAAVARFLA